MSGSTKATSIMEAAEAKRFVLTGKTVTGALAEAVAMGMEDYARDAVERVTEGKYTIQIDEDAPNPAALLMAQEALLNLVPSLAEPEVLE